MSSTAAGKDRVTTAEAAEMLGYRCNRSVLRIVRRGLLTPTPFPRRPLHFYTADVMAVRDGRPVLKDRWAR